MFEVVNRKVWEFLRRKEISLAMIFDIDGNILWHKGRKITGETVHDGGGFSKGHLARPLFYLITGYVKKEGRRGENKKRLPIR